MVVFNLVASFVKDPSNKFSFGSKFPFLSTARLWCGSLLSTASSRYFDLLVSALGYAPCLPGWYVITKLIPDKYSDHWAWCLFSGLMVLKYLRFLCSERTAMGWAAPSNPGRHSWNPLRLVSSSLSCIS